MKNKKQNTALLKFHNKTKHLLLLSLTFVWMPNITHSSPVEETVIDFTIRNEQENNSEPQIEFYQLKTLSITEIEEKTKQAVLFNDREHFFYSYRHAISPRLGMLMNLADPSTPDYLIGIQYLFNWSEESFWEGGADLLTTAQGTGHFARRWIFNSHAPLRPFVKAGGGLILVASDSLRTFLRWENYQIRGGGGMEYWLLGSTSVRTDFELIYTLNQTISVTLTAGYTWAW